MNRRTWTILIVLLGGCVGSILAWQWWERSRVPRVEIPQPASYDAFDPEFVETLVAARDRVAGAPGEGSAWGELGMLYQANGLPALAIPCYRAASTREPDEARWPYLRGLAALDLNQREEAEEAFRESIRLAPEAAAGHWRLGLHMMESGRLAEAAAAFRRARDVQPGDPAGWWGQARCALLQDRPEEARSLMREHLTRDPRDLYARRLLGEAHRALGETELAEQQLREAAGAEPAWRDPWSSELRSLGANPGILIKEGLYWMSQQDYDRAIGVFERARDRTPDDISLLNNLALACLEAGQAERALDLLRDVQEKRPDHYRSYVIESTAAYRAGLFEQALEAADAAVERNDSAADALEAKALALIRLERPTEATQLLEEAARLDRREPRYEYQIAMIHCRAQEWARAEELLLDLTRRHPRFTAGLVGLALAQMEQRRFAEAIETMELAERWATGDPSVRFARQRLAELRGDGAPGEGPPR